MVWLWLDGLGGEYLVFFMKCEIEIVYFFMKEFGYGQVGWDVVSFGFQGFFVLAFSFFGLVSFYVYFI